LHLLDTTYPPGRNDALQWNIESNINGPVRIEITYFTSGITWTAGYVLLCNRDEKKMSVMGNVTVINHSGEDYPNANVRLVVGTINLVEDISSLAKRSISYQKMPPKSKAGMRRRFEGYLKRAGAKDETAMAREKQIIKEGLLEYFIFTIEGRETIPSGWKKRLNAIDVENVPVKVVYRLSDRRTGGKVHKYYEFYNKKVRGKAGKGQLGESPLPGGIVKIFREDDSRNLTYIASVMTKYIPNGDKVKLDSGKNGDIRIRRVVKDYKRTDIKIDSTWSKRHYVKSYKEHFFYRTTLINTLDRKVIIEIERSFSGRFKLRDPDFKIFRVDAMTFRNYPALGPNEKKKIRYEVIVSH
ncbi:DUF4139 domain-containing protein, partial [bacterium]|nr:DUF4139 domain-containing protein [bacterium]